MNTARFALAVLGLSASFGLAAETEDQLKARVEAAAKIEVERVAAPIRSTRGGEVTYVPNRDGKTYDLLLRYYNDYWGPHTVVVLDLGTGQVSRHTIESALFAASLMGPDGKLYETRTGKKGTAVQVYDPADNSFRVLEDEADCGGETRPLAIGTDGMIYGAASKGGRACVFRLEPSTGKIKDYGPVGPSHAPNACWGYSVAADDRFIYVASGKIPWYVVAYDRETGKDEVVLTNASPKGYVGVNQDRYGCTAMSRPGDGTPDVAYWLHEGKTIPKKDPAEKPPWAEPAEKRPWVAAPLRPEVWTGRAVPQADGKAEVWYRTAEAKAAVPKGAAEDDPAAAGWKALGFQVPTYPAHIFRVFALPDGRVGGSGGSYLGNFVYDPATNIAAHLGRLPLSHYSEAVHDGKVYMSGYPSSALYVYDPAKPWTVGRPPGPGTPPLAEDHAQSNPRRVAYLSHHGSGCHKMWSSAVGADGRVYFGGRWYRDGEGGGLGWWDPKAEKPGGLWEPFSNCQVAFITATGQGRYIVASTRAVRDAVLKKPTPQQARLFVFDTMTGQISREIEPVPNAEWTGAVAGVDGDHVLALTVDAAGRAAAKANGATDRDIAYGQCDTASILYKVNVVTGDVLWRKRLPWPVGFCTNENFDHHDGFDFHLGPDGRVWTFTGARFVRVNPNKDWHYSYVNCALVRIDPKDGTLEVVGRLDRGGTMAFVGRDLYLSGGCKYLTDGEHLRRIRSVVP